MKQRKIMKVNDDYLHLECIKTDETDKPYRLYRTWQDRGKHRALIGKYENFHDVVAWMYWNVGRKVN